MFKKILFWAVVLCVAATVFKNPAHASGVVNNAFDQLGTAGTSTAVFLEGLHL
jgi:hypothetical protein